MQTRNNSRGVAPALDKYAQGPIAELWKRPGLAPRGRQHRYFVCFDRTQPDGPDGVSDEPRARSRRKTRELSEVITHLAFYSGWANGMSAVEVASDVYAVRKIGMDQLPQASPALLPLDKESEETRATSVEQQFGNVSPGLVQYTTDVLFRDLWLRPDLAPRDRSLVTVAALIAAGQWTQIPYHLNKAMDNGLTQIEAGELIAHLAFYAGWPNAFSAAGLARDIFGKRPH
ncbi:MAG TPA: carboxymuconolactone decarboxylase family protein [Bryobacteraceae bacterium]|nr:carboxymuconolactone decarboxylase family protein [Bryobacteraceae bacterium]